MTDYTIIDREEHDELGEGALWDAPQQALYWVDILGKAVSKLDLASGKISRLTAPSMVSLAAVSVRDDLILALEDGVYRIDPMTAAADLIARPDPEARNRSNDSKVDPAGRLLVGTMNIRGADGQEVMFPEALGGLYRVGSDGRTEQLLDKIFIPNTLAFTPDGRRVTFSDTVHNVIWTFAYNPEGPLEDRRVLLDGAPGFPDGAAMDVDGCLWNARWGADRVVRITPDGRIDRTLALPVEKPTCCAFGGSDLKTLYVTSARQPSTPRGLGPHDGALFAFDLDVAGVPTNRFAD